VRHEEGLGAFYWASDGIERAEGRTTGGDSVELQWHSRFGWGRKWGGVIGSRGDERGSGTDSFLPREGRGCCAGKVSRRRRCSAERRRVGLQPGEGERQLGLGWAERLHRSVGQMHRCESFRPREEGGCGELRWAKKPERLGPAWEFPRKIQIGLPRPTGRIEEMNRKGP
jgi:hypothetical protein